MKTLFLVLALLAPVESLDGVVQRAVQSARRPGLEAPMHAATRIGRPVIVLGALLAVAIFDPAAGPATARLALAALVPTNLAVEALKWTVNRTRPDGERKRSNSSFPSSHAANAFALAWVLARRYRPAAPGLWAGAAVVAVSRIYLDRHYLSDVLIGAAIGVACAWVAARLLQAHAARPPQPQGDTPG